MILFIYGGRDKLKIGSKFETTKLKFVGLRYGEMRSFISMTISVVHLGHSSGAIFE